MKELREIIAAHDPLRQAGATAALATVVRVDGSAYRRPGARMLVLADGSTVGGVSGGCLEADVVLQARHVMETGQAKTVIYDTTDESDIVFGVGLGCQGIVHILIEPMPPMGDNALTLPAFMLSGRKSGVLATVFKADAGAMVKIGDRCLLRSDGHFQGHQALRAPVEEALRAGPSLHQTVHIEELRADVFWERLQPRIALLVFGAGYDSAPLVRLAKEMGWAVTVVDRRSDFADPAAFPLADAVLHAPREGLPPDLVMDTRTAAVVMTHNYLHDRQLLSALLPSPLAYLGVLGPRRRTESLLQELAAEGQHLTETARACLHAPIGLDIGAETPEQIALAIVAEIQAVIADGSGTPLRDRPGPIYTPESVDVPSLPPPLNTRFSCRASA